jgi:hypothetical protein
METTIQICVETVQKEIIKLHARIDDMEKRGVLTEKEIRHLSRLEGQIWGMEDVISIARFRT